jgi:cytochrome c oxidase subunit IV
LYNPIHALVKASIVRFLWHLEDRQKAIRWSLVAIFILNLGLAIATFVADLCQCTPVSYHWNRHKPDDAEGEATSETGSCVNVVNFFLITAGLSVLTDILIMIIQAAMIWRLKMNRPQKSPSGR